MPQYHRAPCSKNDKIMVGSHFQRNCSRMANLPGIDTSLPLIATQRIMSRLVTSTVWRVRTVPCVDQTKIHGIYSFIPQRVLQTSTPHRNPSIHPFIHLFMHPFIHLLSIFIHFVHCHPLSISAIFWSNCTIHAIFRSG